MQGTWVQTLVGGTRSHMLQLKTPHAARKTEDPTCHSEDSVQPDKYINKIFKRMVGFFLSFFFSFFSVDFLHLQIKNLSAPFQTIFLSPQLGNGSQCVSSVSPVNCQLVQMLLKTEWRVLKKSKKKNHHMIKQSNFGVYIPKN